MNRLDKLLNKSTVTESPITPPVPVIIKWIQKKDSIVGCIHGKEEYKIMSYTTGKDCTTYWAPLPERIWQKTRKCLFQDITDAKEFCGRHWDDRCKYE